MKIYKLLIIVALLGGVIVGYNKYVQKDETVNPIGINVKNELDKILEEESFRKETLLRARKVANDRKKEQEEVRYKEAMKKIEDEYEAIRSEELQIVGTSSLKSPQKP